MKVYMASCRNHHEEAQILGIFSSAALAQQALEDKKAFSSWIHDFYEVEVFEVDKLAE